MKRYFALGAICTALFISAAAFAQDAERRPAPPQPSVEPEVESIDEDQDINVEINRLTEQVRDAVSAAMREMSRMVETTVEKSEKTEDTEAPLQPVELVFTITGVAENMSVVTSKTSYELSVTRSADVTYGGGEGRPTRLSREQTFSFGVQGGVEPDPNSPNLYNVTFEGRAGYRLDGEESLTEVGFDGELPVELGKTVTIARENERKVTLSVRPIETE